MPTDFAARGITLRHKNDLASPASGKGASLVGTSGGGTVQDAISDTLALADRRGVNFDYFSPAKDGITNDGPKLQRAIDLAASLGRSRVRISAGRYFINVNGDSDTIIFPSNMFLDCEDGTVFVWSYWGSPLFAMVNKTNVGIAGAAFEWNGTFGTTSGTRSAFGYATAIPAYEWCCHIAAVGTDRLLLERLSCYGGTSSNRQNVFAMIRPKSDGTRVKNIVVRDVDVNDVCQGFLVGGMETFDFSRISCDRYANDSAGLYGPGHLIYLIDANVSSRNGRFKDLADRAGTPLSSYTSGGHTLSLKNAEDLRIINLVSNRREGMTNYSGLSRSLLQGKWVNTTDATDDTVGGIVYCSGGTNADVEYDLDITMADGRLMVPVNQHGLTDGAAHTRNTGTVRVRYGPISTQSSGALHLCCQNSMLSAYITVTSTGTKKPDVSFRDNANVTNNNIHVSLIGPDATSSSPRAVFAALPTNNRVQYRPSAYFTYDQNSGFADSRNNAVVIGSESDTMASITAVAGSSPSFTLQLPKNGGYLLDLTVINSGSKNHAAHGIYHVIWDSGNSNNFASAAQIGSTVTKGSNVTALAISVASTGVVTIAATTAISDTYALRAGIRRFSGL